MNYDTIIERLERMKKGWENEPPEPGTENTNDAGEMYQCGYCDAIDQAIAIVKQVKNEDGLITPITPKKVDVEKVLRLAEKLREFDRAKQVKEEHEG